MSISFEQEGRSQQEVELQQHLFHNLPKSSDPTNFADSNRQGYQIGGGGNASSVSFEVQREYNLQQKKQIESKATIPIRKRFTAEGNLTQKEQQVINEIDSSRKSKLPYNWRYKFFSILGVLAKYIRYIRLRIIQFHPDQYLSPLHFEIINDQTYFLNPNEEASTFFADILNRDKIALLKAEKRFGVLQKNLLKSYRRTLRWAERQIASLLNPFFNFIRRYVHISQYSLKCWDVIVMIIQLAEILVVSLRITFEDCMTNQTYINFQIPILLILAFDIILCFFKGFQEKGVFQIDSRICFGHYFLDGFWIDFACLLCCGIAMTTNNKILYCFYIIRLTQKHYSYQQTVIDAFQLNERFGTEKIKLIELAFTLLFLAHLIGCVWYWIGHKSLYSATEEQRNSKYFVSWLDAYGLNTQSWQEQYVGSLFWVFTTMTTIGFGDIVPQNLNERLIAIFLMILSCFIFAYSVNSIGVLLTLINEKESFHRQRLKSINSYMTDKKISDLLQSKIRSYLDYIYHEEISGTSQRESSAVEYLSKGLQNQLLVEVNYNVLTKMKIFKSDTLPFSDDLLRKLSLCVKQKTYMPDDIIKQGSNEESVIFHIAKGEIKLQIETKSKNPTVLQILKEGSNFGAFQFMSQEIPPFIAKPTSVTSIYSLKFSDFIKVIHSFQQDFEKFCILREQLLLSSNFDQLNITCSLCSWGNHQEINCPLVNFKPQKNLVISKSDYSRLNKRNNGYLRIHRSKISSYEIMSIVNQQAKEFQEDKGMIFEVQIVNQNPQNRNKQQFSHPQFGSVQNFSAAIPQGIKEQDESSINLDQDDQYTNFNKIKSNSKGQILRTKNNNNNNNKIFNSKIMEGKNQSIIMLPRLDEINEEESSIVNNQLLKERTNLQLSDEFNKSEFSEREEECEFQAQCWREENGYNQLCPWSQKVKGDCIEIDVLQNFNSYRCKDNPSEIIDQINKKQENYQSRLSLPVLQKRSKTRQKKTYVMIPNKFKTSSTMFNGN